MVTLSKAPTFTDISPVLSVVTPDFVIVISPVVGAVVGAKENEL